MIRTHRYLSYFTQYKYIINSCIYILLKLIFQESGLSSSPSDLCSEEENEKVKLQARHSLQAPKNQNNKQLKRVVSVPLDICPPPPPPPPPINTELGNKKESEDFVEVIEEPTVRPSDVVKGMVKSMSGINGESLI